MEQLSLNSRFIFALAYFMPLVYFYTPWKSRENTGFLMFSRGEKNISGIKWVKLLSQILSIELFVLPLSLLTFFKFILFDASSIVPYTCMFMSLFLYILMRMFLFIFPFLFTLVCMIERVVVRCSFYLDWQTYLARVDKLTWHRTWILGSDFVIKLI